MRKRTLLIILLLVVIGFIIGALKAFNVYPFSPKLETLVEKSELPTEIKKEMKEEIAESKKAPKNYKDLINRGDILAEKGFLALAINEYIEASKLSEQNPEPYIKIGKLHLENAQPKMAEEAFKKALSLDPENLNAKINLGRSYLLAREMEKARDIFNQIQVKNQLVKYYQGIIAAYFGDYENSKKSLQEAVEIATSQEVTDKAKNFLNAYDEFSRTLGGLDIHLKTLLARSFNQMGEYDMAIPLLYKVLEQKKDYRDAWILIGYAYLQTQKYKDALDALEIARKLDPGKAETLYFLGLGYFAENNLDEAARHLEAALQAGYEPRIQALQKIAEVYFQKGEYEKATKKYEEVLNINTSDVDYFIRPVWIYIDKLKNADAALKLAAQAIETHPEKSMSYNLLGWAQIASGKYSEAQQNLEKALSIDEKLDAAYLNLGWLNENLRNYTTAKKYYLTAFKLGKDANIGKLAEERYNNIKNIPTVQFSYNDNSF